MLRTLLLSLLITPFMAITVVAATPVVTSAAPLVADSVSDACEGIGLTGGSCGDPAAGRKINSVLATIVNILTAIVGIAAVIMIVIGGLKYVTSGGDSNSVASAKNTVVYAVIGLVIVAIAQVLVHFVLNKAG